MKTATVDPNHFFSVEQMNYSASYEYTKQKFNVYLIRIAVEVFYHGSRISLHPRLYGRLNQYSSIQEHMQSDHHKYILWNGECFIRWAGKIGNSTEYAVRTILINYKVEQQGYQFYIGLLCWLTSNPLSDHKMLV